MLEPIFGGKNVEKVFFYLLVNEKCYGGQLRRVFDQSLFPLQKALERLENGGILVSFLEGKTRLFQFNPRYPFLKELKAFLRKAYEFLPQEIKDQYYEPKIRRRPRKQGKS
ncbi:transcriptional regulator [Candidatus Aerophobetes bacterium]|uniref:Transcriptional regulator n=1 Tax=Aerophobetes bacterium TaxID=2030807 RepID=A0A2A4YMM0_UNCAE|nr:MAG: transcriptional regulator [Candidatus Aerophobetes bacterium]